MQLNRTRLKLIAIAAMVCDHVAWGFLDFNTPLAQIMHVIGRLTIPIMCFFIAEGFKNTSSLKKYILRMLLFWVISVIPFYLFFGEMYDYRQNIIFDLLLGIFALVITTHKTLPKFAKCGLLMLLAAISLLIGGWPLLPMAFILIFYYKKDFKSYSKWIFWFNTIFVTALILLVLLNEHLHFSGYDWIWYDKLYFYGFVLALPLLKLYNGEKGSFFLGRYFFYCFYPAHFIVLYSLKLCYSSFGVQGIYCWLHVVAIILTIVVLFFIARSTPSKAQNAAMVFIAFAMVYMFGFLIEITSTSIDVICAAIKIEYFGECLLIIGVTWFAAEFFRFKMPLFIYYIEILITLGIMTAVCTIQHNTFFYRSITLDTSGPFPRIDLVYGTGFYLFTFYLAVVCIFIYYMGFKTIKRNNYYEKRRIIWLVTGVSCPWIVSGVRYLGLTGNYEITSFGIIGIAFCMSIVLFKYGYFNSMQLAYENALNHSKEGIMVIGLDYTIAYFNYFMGALFPCLKKGENMQKLEHFCDISPEAPKYVVIGTNTYELRMEPLIHSGTLQGYMVWTINMTRHVSDMKRVENLAITDSLTGLYNRLYFKDTVSELIMHSTGTMIMFDVDDFKSINDTYGHETGDKVLIAIGKALKSITSHELIPCRIGGDEFIMFVNKLTDKAEITQLIDSLTAALKEILKADSLPKETTLSIGIAELTTPCTDDADCFDDLYRKADKALYLSKKSGKNQYSFYIKN